ncbi:hypothetical protein PE067_07430 [Paracoccus sp. DMF-8]|uniref:hypothetical protein n=1 Tax=Paracoccus sp. DMF-8 TaxID=3019445 RepID=UPI0023E79910|nr:hypothetical protein [Paracoccus sp. DMF-8]MDF3605981.1 hypothetical protein [Paracoccus sp. DMF-8]
MAGVGAIIKVIGFPRLSGTCSAPLPCLPDADMGLGKGKPALRQSDAKDCVAGMGSIQVSSAMIA